MKEFKTVSLGTEITVHPDLSMTTSRDGKSNKFAADYMKRAAKTYHGMNRIYKPMALLFWTDCKNGKAGNWKLID